MKKIYRPKEGRVFAGVCAGLSERYGWSKSGLRLLFLILIPLPPSALLIYLLLWIIIPNQNKNQHSNGKEDSE